MSLSHSPQIVTNGLVFAYDMGNTQKSWKGAPTTNILPSPENNGRFTTSNSWGTFNTNQYNNNQYFSIGTISSVTDNIVTTSGNHPLRTYDAVTPQTTGGGVIAGTNYFVKKISNTQFSLHAYNGSENGSQGYKVSGYHKVHESIATDQRVAINSTNFPTMWWGPPHLPNSGLVKEIVNGEGPQAQSVMRLHVHRTDGVADGMAYGVYTPVTAGDIINVSYWVRSSYPGKTLGYSTYFGGAAGYSNETVTTTQWQRVKFQWTASATFTFYQYWWPGGSVDVPYFIDICDLQVEVNTGTARSTPFVAGSRSNTQAILDLTGNNTITANSLTYNSDGTFSYLNNSGISIPSINFADAQTIEIWLKPLEADGNRRNPYNQAYGGYGTWTHEPDGTINYFYGDAGANNTPYVGHTSSFTVAQNEVACVCTTRDLTTSWWYKNGVQYNSYNHSYGSLTTDNNNILIGNGYAGAYYGDIFAVKLYNRALSAAEVRQNFNALRGRYGI